MPWQHANWHKGQKDERRILAEGSELLHHGPHSDRTGLASAFIHGDAVTATVFRPVHGRFGTRDEFRGGLTTAILTDAETGGHKSGPVEVLFGDVSAQLYCKAGRLVEP